MFSLRMRGHAPFGAQAALLSSLLILLPHPAGGADELTEYIERLPDTTVYCALADRKSQLIESLSAIAANIFVDRHVKITTKKIRNSTHFVL